MFKTLVVGNVLYGAAVVVFWITIDGNRERFVPALVFATLTFFAGILTGIIANQPRAVKKRNPVKKRSVSSHAYALESLGEPEPAEPVEQAPETPTAFDQIEE